MTEQDAKALEKEIRQAASPFAYAIAGGLAGGWIGAAVGWFGYRGVQKYVVPEIRKDIESFRKLKADLAVRVPPEPVAADFELETKRQREITAWAICIGVGIFAAVVLIAAFTSGG